MDKQLVELALTLFGKTAIKNGDNGTKAAITNGIKKNREEMNAHQSGIRQKLTRAAEHPNS